MIQYRMHKAQGVLAQFVRFFWSLDVRVDGTNPFIHRALPDNCSELIFYRKGALAISSSAGEEGSTFTSGLFGQAQKFRQFRTNRDFSLFGVYLYPYTFKALFNLPANRVSDDMISSETLWGIHGKILEEQIMLAPNVEQCIQHVSDFFLDRIKAINHHDHGFAQRVKSVIDYNSLLSISSLADDCNLSRRQFERKFKDYSGFSPKEFFNIVRFKNVLKEAERERKSLAQIAIESGYYDQSHFANEFKKFSGYTPKEFFANYDDTLDPRATLDFRA